MPTQDELFSEYGRPDAVTAPKALELLGLSGQVPMESVQAFGYLGKDMMDAFTNGGQSEPGRKFLGSVLVREGESGLDYYVAAWQITDATQAALERQNRPIDRPL